MRIRFTSSIALSFLGTVAFGPDAICNSDTTPAQWVAAQATYLSWNETNPGWRRTDDGLEYRLLGAAHLNTSRPTSGCSVTANYEGRLIDGELFDDSKAHNGPLTFSLGHLIKGWQEGLPLMHVGETYAFAIPASLAYGSKRFVQDGKPFVSIPADSALLFKIELVALPVCTPKP